MKGSPNALNRLMASTVQHLLFLGLLLLMIHGRFKTVICCLYQMAWSTFGAVIYGNHCGLTAVSSFHSTDVLYMEGNLD